ncbi:MAG: tetratricopeptide repeat protein, partial [Deltaproteobacteria bacterium]|nr:tetratricopeptide repeat protein [Deltaproteobacteria bacterium]
NLSIVYNEVGEFDKGMEVYQRAKEAELGDMGTQKAKMIDSYLDPNVKGKVANMHADIGHIYKDLNMLDNAIVEYEKALVLSPGFVDIKTMLGAVYREKRNFTEALKHLEEAVALNPDFTPSRVQLGLTYYVMGQIENSRNEWLKVLKKSPDDKLARMYMNLIEKNK